MLPNIAQVQAQFDDIFLAPEEVELDVIGDTMKLVDPDDGEEAWRCPCRSCELMEAA